MLNRTRAHGCQKCKQSCGESRIQDFSVAIAERENRRIPRGAWSIFLTRFFVSFSSMEKDRKENCHQNLLYPNYLSYVK
jgi:hypothetical protein